MHIPCISDIPSIPPVSSNNPESRIWDVHICIATWVDINEVNPMTQTITKFEVYDIGSMALFMNVWLYQHIFLNMHIHKHTFVYIYI